MYLLLLAIFSLCSLSAFDKVVLWGHKLHSHTHSYIHEGFVRGFKHLGYNTYYLDEKDDISNLDLSNALFITEGQVETGMPLRQDAIYLLHNTREPEKFTHLKAYNLQKYTYDIEEIPTVKKIAPFTFYDFDTKTVYIMWATDLLPHEIDEIKHRVPFFKKTKTVWWVGTLGEGLYGNLSVIRPFAKACKENKIEFIRSDPWLKGIDRNPHILKIQESYMAPAIVGEWQRENGYIPCRIFKNISYGQWGITNSKAVYDLFEGKVTYNADTYQLFFDAIPHLNNYTALFELMDIVRDKHTYLNRIDTILDFLKQMQAIEGSQGL